MVANQMWRRLNGWKIRVNSACRCLFFNHYVLVCWEKCEDGELDFKISHKGVELTEAVHRLGVDAVEILQNACDQEDAIDQANSLIKRYE